MTALFSRSAIIHEASKVLLAIDFKERGEIMRVYKSTTSKSGLTRLIIGLVFTLASAFASSAATITVNGLGNTIAIDGFCSLREAIQAANSDVAVNECGTGSGTDTITFAVSGDITFPIGVFDPLPAITTPMTIDGAGQTVVIRRVGGGATLTVNTIAGAEIKNLTFTEAFNGSLGGAIVNVANLTLTNITFNGNHSSQSGGAIANLGGTLKVINCTFSGNNANAGGGAIFNQSGNVDIQFSTFSGNTGQTPTESSGAILNRFGVVTVSNSIFANSTCGTGITDGGNNLDSGSTCGFSNSGIEPMLGSLQDNGGSAKTFALMTGSPAINAGLCDANITTDQRGVSRPQGAGCDIGSFEVEDTDPPAPTVTSVNPPTGSTAGGYTVSITGTNFTVTPSSITFGGSPCASITRISSQLVTCVAPSHAAGSVDVSVTTPAGTGTGVGVFTYVAPGPRTLIVDVFTDTDNGSLNACTGADGDCSLRGAIGAANDGDSVEISLGSTLTKDSKFAPQASITLASAIGITSDVNIVGPGASLLTIDGAGTFRIFGIATGATVNISGMTLANADAGGGSVGGAIIQNPSSTLTLDGMVITGNLAASGGGIYTSSATLNVKNSTISDNETENQGGGIYNAESNVTITDSIISGNTARYPQPSQGGGGGIFSGTPSFGSLTITGSTISNNCAGTRAGSVCTAGSRGGGVSATSANISNTVISGNVATAGAGIQHTNGLTLTNSTVSGNTATGSGGGTFGGGFPSLTVIGSTFSANSATVNGGGIYLDAANPSSIQNSTFSDNTAATGDGGNLWIFTAGVSSVTSSTFAGGTVHNESFGGFQLPVSNSIFAASCTGTDIINTGFNIDSGTGCGFGSANNSKSNTNPLLGPLQNNGGPTWTHGFNLTLGVSPAIDQGSAFGLTADQRGGARTVDFTTISDADDGTDIGAFEMVVPTAAPVSISGRVLDSNGRAIRGALVTVQGIDGVSQYFTTNSFGHYRFDGLATGSTYVVSATSKRYTFASRTVSLDDNVTGLDITPSP